ncbi:type VI secretion system-associated FHA domain protein TagH [Roseococcus thiosulfatophilus]|uniref:type VI secretion system-associated FHA domain protein TagH n=1 Tax=Roseococcus thiosulfatophilus TaxID=35813 RepID=UPI001A8FED12|nr:type VI secretion system-associated FHA domain protein TagH [Roseococcus thiosulfatophilus]
MVLVLSVLRCPDQAVPEQRQVPGGEYTLGRGAECDWPLTDPDRVLSKRHCALEYLAGGWQLRDLSTNGTFVNGAAEPVGRDQVRPLRDGDRLRLGAYEIECRVMQEAGFGEARWASASALPDPMAPPPPSDIFAAPLPGLGPAGGPPAGGAPLLPSDFDPFAPDAPGHSLPDHRPGTQDVFVPPRATLPDLLPEDWNTPPAPPRAPDPADPFAHLPDPFADAPPPGAPPARPLPDPLAPPRPAFGAPLPGLTPAPLPDPFAEAPPPAFTAPLPGLTPARDPFAQVPPAAPAPPSAADPFAEPPGFAAAPPPMAAPSGAPAPPPAAVMGAPPMTSPGPEGLQAALDMLLRGAGLPPAAPGTDPAAAIAQAGAALRAAVGGLRALLIARGDVKREFRIEQTMLRAAGNNPLKFAATDEAALQALLAPRGGGSEAVRETVEDLTAHQLATIAATQAAARALLARLAPAGLEAEQPAGGIALPGAREKRLWEAYRRLHQQVHDQFEDDFDSAFGKAFARAYEQATRGGR